MRLTPTGGVIMVTRSGDLDPGVSIYLAREKKFGAPPLSNSWSITVPACWECLASPATCVVCMRSQHQMPMHGLPFKCFVIPCASRWPPDGADMLVCTGGIGENDAQARAESCGGLSWIGVKLDPARNRSGENSVSNRESRCAVRGVARAGTRADR